MPRSGLETREVNLGHTKDYAPKGKRNRGRHQCRSKHQSEQVPCRRFTSSLYCFKKVDRNFVS